MSNLGLSPDQRDIVKSEAVRHWNGNYPAGTAIRFWTGKREGEGRTGRTYSAAERLGGHTPVVYVRDDEGRNCGAIALSHVEPIAAD